MVPGVFNLPAAAIVLLVAALLVIGIRQSANTNTVLVVIKVVVLIVFVGARRGLRAARESDARSFRPTPGTFGAVRLERRAARRGVMFFAYIGFDAVSTAAQEARNPQRDMPIGILASLGICTVHLHRGRASC